MLFANSLVLKTTKTLLRYMLYMAVSAGVIFGYYSVLLYEANLFFFSL